MSATGKGFDSDFYNLVEFYNVGTPVRQTEPISRQKLSGFPALDEWEQGFDN
jgi:hypothetical protein